MQAYTASFFAIPAFRWFFLQRQNAEIEQRNRSRLGWVAALERAGADLRQKVCNEVPLERPVIFNDILLLFNIIRPMTFDCVDILVLSPSEIVDGTGSVKVDPIFGFDITIKQSTYFVVHNCLLWYKVA